jgi:formate hydrogenlyase subunit 3/multisubunit Na+/H+ antiporter MnhD subunit
MSALFVEAIGWVGAGLILTGYIMLTRKVLTSESRMYHLLNLFGGLGIVVEAVSNSAFPPATLNIIWSLVAVYAILKTVARPKT